MPIYRLRCVLRFQTEHAGTAIDTVDIGAPDAAAAAVALAEMYRCSTPGMDLSVAVLTDPAGRPIWTRRMPEQGDLHRLRNAARLFTGGASTT